MLFRSYTGMFGLTVNLVITLLRLGVLALGAWLILDDRMSVGSLVAFLAIMGEVIGPVTSLTGLGQVSLLMGEFAAAIDWTRRSTRSMFFAPPKRARAAEDGLARPCAAAAYLSKGTRSLRSAPRDTHRSTTQS